MNSNRMLVWHRKSTESKTYPPVAVRVWIEQGCQLDSALIHPKFCWRNIHSKQEHDRSILLISRYDAIDLLDVSRILQVDEDIDRAKYPYVKKSRCFVIEAFDQEICLEARDEMERDDLVERLKLLVSRLGSKIISGDGTVLEEFFSPMAFVEGKVPSIFED